MDTIHTCYWCKKECQKKRNDILFCNFNQSNPNLRATVLRCGSTFPADTSTLIICRGCKKHAIKFLVDFARVMGPAAAVPGPTSVPAPPPPTTADPVGTVRVTKVGRNGQARPWVGNGYPEIVQLISSIVDRPSRDNWGKKVFKLMWKLFPDKHPEFIEVVQLAIRCEQRAFVTAYPRSEVTVDVLDKFDFKRLGTEFKQSLKIWWACLSAALVKSGPAIDIDTPGYKLPIAVLVTGQILQSRTNRRWMETGAQMTMLLVKDYLIRWRIANSCVHNCVWDSTLLHGKAPN